MDTDIENKEKNLKDIAEKIGVDLVLLFGSRADDSNRKDSDFDIAYSAEKNLSSEEESELHIAIMNYVNSDNLHITGMRGIKPLFLYEIMRNCKVLFAKNMMKFYELRVYAFRRYYDEVVPLYDIIFNKLKKEYSI